MADKSFDAYSAWLVTVGMESIRCWGCQFPMLGVHSSKVRTHCKLCGGRPLITKDIRRQRLIVKRGRVEIPRRYLTPGPPTPPRVA